MKGGAADLGSALWVQQADLPSVELGQLPATAEVVVVGGGYTGIAAGRELARLGRDVLVLEQGELGAGASARNAGLAHSGLRRSLPELCTRFGPDLGRALFQETVIALEHVGDLVQDAGIECDYGRHGYLYLAPRPSHAKRLERTQAALAEAGYEARMLTGEQVAEEAGTRGYAAGLLLDEAASVHPARFLEGLTRDGMAAGMGLSAHTRVDALAQRATGGVDVVTPRGTVRAQHVLVATDGYSGGVLPYLRRRIIPIESFVVATEPLTPELQAQVSPEGHLCLETKNFLSYWRLSGDGRLIFGGRASFAPTTVERASRWLREQMLRVYPALEGVGVASAWGGKTGFSFDQLPHMGREGDISYAVTYCGGGVALATWFGTRSARWINGDPAPPFSKIPFPRVPLFNGRPWFLPLVGPVFAAQDRFA